MKDAPSQDIPAPPIRPMARSLPIQLLAAHDRVMRYFRPMLQKFGITDQQWRVMRVIAEGEDDFRALANASLIQPASLSRMLDGLAGRGLVTRTVNGADRRQRTIALTQAGRDLFDAAAAETEALYVELEADLGDLYAPTVEKLNGVVGRLDR